DGRIPGDPEGVLEPFTALAWLAAHTSRIRLGTGICLVPQRNPIYTAKQAADVDFLSGGRLELGVGIGWLREEFASLGVPWENRAARTRECLEVMKALWCHEVSEHHGELWDVGPCVQNPKPVQKPHPPVFFGGESDAALRRVAELGQGWYGFQVDAETLPGRLERLDALLAEAVRSRDEILVYVSPAGRPREPGDLAPFADAGVDQVILPFFARDAEGLERRADAFAKLAA
ncbi:MAG: TIGR03619 family F420-dependent LLM class oxidoreductase, partial [Thermoanaerobaculia bacterium]|nr:TIGR03619 family F420-dependent LLM class oxidoreductase [Thermoanaerobaculia bacterium]